MTTQSLVAEIATSSLRPLRAAFAEDRLQARHRSIVLACEGCSSLFEVTHREVEELITEGVSGSDLRTVLRNALDATQEFLGVLGQARALNLPPDQGSTLDRIRGRLDEMRDWYAKLLHALDAHQPQPPPQVLEKLKQPRQPEEYEDLDNLLQRI